MKKRQKIRKGVILVSFLFFPITIYYFSPVQIVDAAHKGVFNGPTLRLAVEKELCKDCRKCDKECPMSIDVNEMVKKGNIMDSECVLCGSCVDVCPEGVLSYSFERGK